jgi:hypothetical protein
VSFLFELLGFLLSGISHAYISPHSSQSPGQPWPKAVEVCGGE